MPEIYEGVVEIRSISRSAGERTKIAVWSKDEKIDSVGSCVGMRGARVKNIVNELHGEKNRHSPLQRGRARVYFRQPLSRRDSGD